MGDKINFQNKEEIVETPHVHGEGLANQFFKILPDPILLMDLITGDILEANKAFDDLYGESISSLRGKNIFDMEMFSLSANPSDFYKDILEVGKAENYDSTFTKASGELLNISLSGTLTTFEGQEILIGVLRDVTGCERRLEKIRSENDVLSIQSADERFHRELLEESASESVALLDQVDIYKNELEKLNSQKDRFFSIIAHDLKSPFSAVLGFSSMLKDNMESFDKVQVAEFADYIHSSATNAYDILNDLLDWAMTQMGRISYEPKSYALVDGIKKVQKVFTPLANAKEIELIWDIEESLETISDQKMVETILRNLIGNSIKFTKPKGSITTLARRNEKGIEVSVTDDGIGMTNGQLDTLFSILNHSSTQGTAGELGTGLGLTLCQEFVELHGGVIKASSEVGKGTCFSFNIPDQEI